MAAAADDASEVVLGRYRATLKKLQTFRERIGGKSPGQQTLAQQMGLQEAMRNARAALGEASPVAEKVETAVKLMEDAYAAVVAKRGYPFDAPSPEVRAPDNLPTMDHIGRFVDTFRWAKIDSGTFAPEVGFYPDTLALTGDRRIYNQGTWAGSINDPSGEVYYWERGRRNTGQPVMKTDEDGTPVFDEEGNLVFEEADEHYRYNPMHTYADANGNDVYSVLGDEAGGKKRWAWLPLTEEKKCFYWAYKLKGLFVRRELVTRERLEEVGHMVEALTVTATLPKYERRVNNEAIAFLQDISRPGGLCELPGLRGAIDAALRAQREYLHFARDVTTRASGDAGVDASYARWMRLAEAADARASAMQSEGREVLVVLPHLLLHDHQQSAPGPHAQRRDGLARRRPRAKGHVRLRRPARGR